MTGEEIRSNLLRLAARWAGYRGTERAGAQPFLEGLFAAYGVDRMEVGAEFEVHQDDGGFADLIWPGQCIFEMKAPQEATRLIRHRQQARRYWENAARPGEGVPSPDYVVLCAFHQFEVWDFGHFPNAPRTTFTLAELPDRYDALLFLVGQQPVFTGNHADVTREATSKLVAVHESLGERREGGPDERRDFILELVWCMFAEDVAQIPGHRFTAIIEYAPFS